MARSTILKGTGLLSILSGLATSILLLILAVSFTINGRIINTISIAAAALETVSLICLAWLVLQSTAEQGKEQDGWRNGTRRRDVGLCFVMSVLAQGSTIGTIVWMRIELGSLPPVLDHPPVVFLACLGAFCGLSVLLQGSLFVLLLKPHCDGDGEPSQPLSETVLLPDAPVSRPGTSKSATPSNPFNSANVYQSTTTTPRTASMISLRSLTVPTRSFTSKSKAAGHIMRTSATYSSPSSASPRLSTESAFDTWDTSTVAPQLREAVLASHPSMRSASRPRSPLPPIPGSRPVSPAKPLDGPFPAQVQEEDLRTDVSQSDLQVPQGSMLVSPYPAVSRSNFSHRTTLRAIPASTEKRLSGASQHSRSSSTNSLPPPPRFPAAAPLAYSHSSESLPLRRKRPNDIHIPRSVSVSSLASTNSFSHLRSPTPFTEDHIHPLFRTNSPTPPPTATPSTVVTAAPVDLADVPITLVRYGVDRVRAVRSPSIPGSTAGSTGGSPLAKPDSWGTLGPDDGDSEKEKEKERFVM